MLIEKSTTALKYQSNYIIDCDILKPRNQVLQKGSSSNNKNTFAFKLALGLFFIFQEHIL